VSLSLVSADDLLQSLDGFDAVIDARSEDEYLLDHLPGAVNWPTLRNDERREIGTIYKQVNPFEARKRGAAIAAHNIGVHIAREVIDKGRDWKPPGLCRGGGERRGPGGSPSIRQATSFSWVRFRAPWISIRVVPALNSCPPAPRISLF